jgi:Conserved protein/domain typically associated with flavoprotein oxygenases, DIM6/NTAB family
MLKEVNLDDLNFDFRKKIRDEWVLITAKKPDNSINTLTASWGEVGNLWNLPIYTCFIRPDRYTHEFISSSGYYSVCFFDNKYKEQLKYCGSHTGRNENKIAKMGFTVINDDVAPFFKEAKLVLLCRIIYKDDFVKEGFVDENIYKNVYNIKHVKPHTRYIGEIVKVLESE